MSVETTASPVAAPAPPAETSGRGGGLGLLLAVCCVAQFMVILDLSIVNVALPSIQSSLGFTSPELQWIVDAYAITFAGFLMLGGRAADHFGQRRMFVLALLVFALASLAGGVAADRTTLIAARAGQGVGGALMAACSLAIITSSFAPGPQLNRAIGAWAAMNGLGGAAGMLFGGIITQELSWRWVLLINPPIGVAAAVVAYAVVSERRRAPGRSFDLAGALTLTIGQMVLVFGVVEAGLKGWDTFAALGPIIGGVLILAVFGVIETRFASEPLIPFKELTKPLRIANNIVLLFSASLFPMWFVSSLYLQQVLGLSPLHTGLIFLPMTLMIMAVASRAGKLVSRFGVRPVLGGGLDDAGGGDAADGQNRLQRQRDRVHHAARTAHGGGDRDVDRPLDDRRHSRGQGGAGGAGLGPGQHLAPDRGRPGPRDPGDARHAALQPPDRHGCAGAAGAHRRLPPCLPDRRWPRRGGGARHVPGGARSRRRAARSGAPPDGGDRRRRRRLHRDRPGVRRLARRACGRLHDRRRLQLCH